MAIMKKDVNLGLLLLIIAALIMFSGFTVYYQTTFKNLSATYQKQLNELGQITKDLEAKRGLLNQTNVQLQVNQQKQEDLSKKFTDVSTERDQLYSDKNKLTADLASTKATLVQTQVDLSNTKSQLAQTAMQLEQKIRDLNNALADVTFYKPYKAKYECVATKVDAKGQSC